MHVLVIAHQDDAGPGVFTDALGEAEVTTWRPDRGEPLPALDRLGAALVLGAAANVREVREHPWLVEDKRVVGELIERRIPTLGVCLGAQLIAEAAGGRVRRAPEPEIGWYEIRLTEEARGDPLLDALPPRFPSFQWHSYEAVPPRDSTTLARSDRCLQAFRLAAAPAWGVQFHAEVSDADARHWIEHHEVDPDAVAMGIDPVALQGETEAGMPEWHALGRTLFTRFLETARGDRTYSGVT